MKSRVGGRGLWVEGVFEISVCEAGPAGNQRCKLVQRLISLLGIHLISDRHSLYRPNMGD